MKEREIDENELIKMATESTQEWQVALCDVKEKSTDYQQNYAQDIQKKQLCHYL